MLRAATVLLLALPVWAGDSTISIPLRHLKFKSPLTEGQRGLTDVFPYIAAGDAELRPETLSRALKGKIDSERAAIKAVRIFVAGPVVRDEGKAKKMIQNGINLMGKLKHLRMKVLEYRPKSYKPTAVKGKLGWRVSLVGFEMDRMLRLVHIEAMVTVEGVVKIERKPIVDGPMTSWQTAMIAGASKDDQDAAIRVQREMRDEAVLARRVYAKALAPACDLDTAWAIARLRLSAAQMEDLWGKHDRIVGSGVYLVARDLKGGGAIIYDAGDKTRAVLRMSHVREAPAPMRVGPVLHVLARAR